MIVQFRHLYEDHIRGHTAAPNLADRALHLASALLGTIQWVASFLPPSPTSRRMLASILEGYIVAVEGGSGWKLEVDSRFSICFFIQPSIKTYLAFLLSNLSILRAPNQAKIVATKKYKIGNHLEGLVGFTAPLTKTEEEILQEAGRLFSVGHGK